MKLETIESNDISVRISADFNVNFRWSASFASPTELQIRLKVNSAMRGEEELTIILSNSKKFRAAVGGCVIPSSFQTTMISSFSEAVGSAKAASGFTMYFIMAGIFGVFALLWICGSSLKMIWSLINTLQLISYLPIMIAYYPEHVKVMFDILSFSNMEIEIFSDLFKSAIKIDNLEVAPYNKRFSKYGIESPLFLDV
jgi:hypothetical protein